MGCFQLVIFENRRTIIRTIKKLAAAGIFIIFYKNIGE